MVSVLDNVPDAIEAEPDPARQKQLLVEWFRQFHGSRREAKVLLVMASDELDLDVDGDDVETVTGEPPVNTRT